MNPYRLLEVSPQDSDEEIRAAYLQAVRAHPPERDPAKFQQIREAYERIRSADQRLELLLFDPRQGECIDQLIAEEQCQNPAGRIGLKQLRQVLKSLRA